MRIRVLFLGLLLLTSVACGTNQAAAERPNDAPEATTLRLGYFPNLTHAQAIVGLSRGTFTEELGTGVRLDTKVFNAGPSAIEALFAGEIDATYIGPNPAINGYVRSEGKALRIIAGAASGGAMFVVRPESGISNPSDLAGKKIGSPQLGNTQDVALRSYLLDHGLASRESGGNVTVVPAANPDILTLFRKGEIDGAWVPEPWATRLVQEAGGKVFLDERQLWPNGDFVTTHLIVRTEFLDKNPRLIGRLLAAHVDTTRWINANPVEARRLVNEGIRNITTAALPDAVFEAAWQNLRFTYDPIVPSLKKSAADAFRLGFAGRTEPDLSGIYVLTPLNSVLRSQGLSEVAE